MNKWISVIITALTDFIITGGGMYLTTATTTSLPTTAQTVAAVVLGLVQAARGVQKTLSPPPA